MKKLLVALLVAIVALIACNPTPDPHKFGAGVIPTTFTAGAITASTSFTQTPLAGGGSQIVTANNSGVFGAQALSTVANRAYYGDGNDGAATFDGSATPQGVTKNSSTSYTLNRDVYYTSATVSASVIVSTNGWRFFCTGLLTLATSSAIDNSGAAGAAGTGSGTASGGVGTIGQSIGGPAVSGGAAGSVGGPATGNCYGGAGGAGGTGGSAGGACTPSSANVRPGNVPDAISGVTLLASAFGASGNINYRFVQGGGGGGGGKADVNSGGGGAQGSVVMVATQAITGAGNLRSNGGAGGNAISTGAPGGGGGGGCILLVTSNTSGWTGTTIANGGAAGTGGVAGATAGSVGQSFIIPG